MARGNSRAQSELVDRLQDKIANRAGEKALAKARAAEAKAQEDKKSYKGHDQAAIREALSKGPLSVMKNTVFAKVMTEPGAKSVRDPAEIDKILELAFDKTDLDELTNYEQDLESEKEDEDGDFRNYVDEDGRGFDGDETETTVTFPSIFVEKDGKVFRVQREVSIPIEITEGGVMRSTATSKEDISISSRGIVEVNMRPGEYIKNGKMFRTYDTPVEFYGMGGVSMSKEEQASPEFKKARKEFEAFESQVRQFNSIIDKNPRLDKNLKVKFDERVFESVDDRRGSRRYYSRFN